MGINSFKKLYNFVDGHSVHMKGYSVKDDTVLHAIVKIDEIRGANQKDTDAIMECALWFNTVLNSPEFKQRVTNPPFILDHTKGMSYSQIYELIMSGKVDLDPREDHELNIKIELYYNRFSRTIGYTMPNTIWQYYNRKYFGYSRSAKMTNVNNLCHEYCHKAGFEHESRGYTQRNIPYFYGNSMELIANQIIK